MMMMMKNKKSMQTHASIEVMIYIKNIYIYEILFYSILFSLSLYLDHIFCCSCILNRNNNNDIATNIENKNKYKGT